MILRPITIEIFKLKKINFYKIILQRKILNNVDHSTKEELLTISRAMCIVAGIADHQFDVAEKIKKRIFIFPILKSNLIRK